MSANLIAALLDLPGSDREIAASGTLFHQGDRVASVFIVREGALDLVRHGEDGRPVVLQRAGPDTVLAEASIFSDRYHCSAVARTDSRLRAIRKPDLTARLRADPALAQFLMAHLAREVQGARFRSEVLAMNRVADRLDAWLSWHDGVLPERGDWRSLAAEIAVSPEALYRELALRRRK